MEKHIHIVSFDVPFPADYGGVMDVYYKIKALHKQGIHVHLHAFAYGRMPAPELDAICASVHYYKRDTSWTAQLSLTPYIVESRVSEQVKTNLLQDQHPILMEGLHTTAIMLDKRFSKRRLIYRESNIEHQYYNQLAMRETKWMRKLFFKLESWKLKRYEPSLTRAHIALVVSQSDQAYLQSQYPTLQSHYLPSFHPNEELYQDSVKGSYVLFHGNLSVSENIDAALFLASVLKETPYRFILAGKQPSAEVLKVARSNANFHLFADPDDATMKRLVAKAKVNVLYTKESAGLKLKLLNVLFTGGHVLCNSAMLVGTGLDSLCSIAEDKKQFLSTLETLMSTPFTNDDWNRRKEILLPRFSNESNAKELISLVYGDH